MNNIDQLKARLDEWIDDPHCNLAYIHILRDCKTALEFQQGQLIDCCRELGSKIEALRSELEDAKKFKTRLEWLHSGGGLNDRDPEWYEWGVARVKFHEHGQPISVLWTLSDHSDLDAEIERTKNQKR